MFSTEDPDELRVLMRAVLDDPWPNFAASMRDESACEDEYTLPTKQEVAALELSKQPAVLLAHAVADMSVGAASS